MEFDIGNILYIVITIVAITVGLLGKKKKPASGAGQSGGQAQPGFLENLERAFNMGQQEQAAVSFQDYDEALQMEEMEIEEATPVTETEPMTLMEEYELSLQSRHGNQYADLLLTESDALSEPLEIVDLDREEGTDYFEVIQQFDAGSAIVYSAIINRIDY